MKKMLLGLLIFLLSFNTVFADYDDGFMHHMLWMGYWNWFYNPFMFLLLWIGITVLMMFLMRNSGLRLDETRKH